MNEYIDDLNGIITYNMLNKINLNLNKYKSGLSGTGYKGVYKHKDKFRVQLVNNYKRYSLGVYNNIDIAAKKYAMIDFLLKNNLKGGVSFNTGIEEIKCKKKKDCSDAFSDLTEKEKVRCNRKTGICERYFKVENYFNEKVDCRKKENRELAECKTNKPDCRKKENKKLAKCKTNKPDCRKKINKNKKVCIEKKNKSKKN
jgi:hypothetical protein